MGKKTTVLIIALVFLFTGAALAAGPKAGGTLIFGRGGDSVGLDPAYETDGNSFMICDNVLEALVEYADETTAIEPGLAESWTISPDGKTYTFKLRKGVKFHDGTPFNSDAVVFSIGRQMKERKVKFFGKGWEIPAQEKTPEYWVTMEMDNTVESIEATDDHTVVFKLKRVEAPFLANLGMDFADIISPTAFVKNPKEFIRNPVGTGPFKLAKWVKDDQILLEKNTDCFPGNSGQLRSFSGTESRKYSHLSVPECCGRSDGRQRSQSCADFPAGHEHRLPVL
jgi:peptide/nickel transport system substrate-binding protein